MSDLVDVDEQNAKPIALVPIGQVDESILTVIGEGLWEALSRAYVIVDTLPYPNYAYDPLRKQYLADDILAQLSRLDLDAERWLGVADPDLYTPGLNFVFGQARMGGPAAVIALPRLRQGFYGLPDDEALFHQRAVKEAVHELGHTYGLGHCRNPRCVMSFSNSLPDVDRKGHDFCPSCRRKLP
ncbi:MAG: archaemetzincin family Zn-dependent metalloprotease [Anaerolineae bacterium]